MRTVTTKTLWHNQVGINEEKYVKPALAAGDGLAIILIEMGSIMEIPADKVGNYVARSQEVFHDAYGGPDYHLVYYPWKPTAVQEALL
jgi:hypothetical protein